MKIIGAGMAGLLAANLLRHRNPTVVEKSPTCPNNHRAILRFSSPLVGEALRIPFREVTLVKSALAWKNPVADILAYSEKIGGKIVTDRSISRLNIEVSKRWIAPPDLIAQMAMNVGDLRLGVSHDFTVPGPKVLSTIPMPDLARALDYPMPEFPYRHGYVVSAFVEQDTDAYATLYVPNPAIPFYRASITGAELTVETLTEPHYPEALAEEAAELLGVRIARPSVSVKPQAYLKIFPIDNAIRKKFIHEVSSERGIAFSLGRFATWRPGLVTEHLLNDIRLIDGWISEGEGSRYAMEIHDAEKKRSA
jgi:hypothetical protein